MRSSQLGAPADARGRHRRRSAGARATSSSNLVDNAVKYLPPAGSRISVGASEEDGRVRLVVSDTGPGIAAEHLSRVFERFYRASTPAGRASWSTGLGLSRSWKRSSVAGSHARKSLRREHGRREARRSRSRLNRADMPGGARDSEEHPPFLICQGSPDLPAGAWEAMAATPRSEHGSRGMRWPGGTPAHGGARSKGEGSDEVARQASRKFHALATTLRPRVSQAREPTMLAVAIALTVTSLALYVVMMVLFARAVLRRRASATRKGAWQPRVSVLKPLARDGRSGGEPRVPSRQDYPAFEILIGVADRDDVSVATAQRFAANHPEIDVRFVLTDPDAALNPKVAQLVGLEPHATGDVFVMSDSNVRAGPGYPGPMHAGERALQDPRRRDR